MIIFEPAWKRQQNTYKNSVPRLSNDFVLIEWILFTTSTDFYTHYLFLYEYPNIYIVEQKNLCSTAHYNLFEKIAYISRYSRFFVFICIWIKKIPLDYEQALIY